MLVVSSSISLFSSVLLYLFLALVHKQSLLYLISIFCIFCLQSNPPLPFPPLCLFVCLFSVSTFFSSLSVLSLSFILHLSFFISQSSSLSHCLLPATLCLHLLVFLSFTLSTPCIPFSLPSFLSHSLLPVYLSPCLSLLVFLSFSLSTSFHLSLSSFLFWRFSTPQHLQKRLTKWLNI